MAFSLGNYADQLSLDDNPLSSGGSGMGDPMTISAGIMAGSQLLNGAMQGMQKKPAGVLQIQPNKYSNYYQDLFPSMLKNELSAYGDNGAQSLAQSPAYAGMFGQAGTMGNPGYAGTRSPSGYSNGAPSMPQSNYQQTSMPMMGQSGGGGGSNWADSLGGPMAGLIPQVLHGIFGKTMGTQTQANPMSQPMPQPGTQGPGNPNVMRTRKV